MVALDSMAVDGKIIQGLQADGAIMDTGTSLITASAADAATINAVRDLTVTPMRLLLCRAQFEVFIFLRAAFSGMCLCHLILCNTCSSLLVKVLKHE